MKALPTFPKIGRPALPEHKPEELPTWTLRIKTLRIKHRQRIVTDTSARPKPSQSAMILAQLFSGLGFQRIPQFLKRHLFVPNSLFSHSWKVLYNSKASKNLQSKATESDANCSARYGTFNFSTGHLDGQFTYLDTEAGAFSTIFRTLRHLQTRRITDSQRDHLKTKRDANLEITRSTISTLSRFEGTRIQVGGKTN